MSDDEIEKMVKEAEENAESDKKKREAVDTRNHADSLINETEKNLKEHGDKIPESDKNKITEDNVNNALKQVRRALLEADVSLSVVKEFVEEVRQKAIGEEVVRGVKPGEKFIEVVHKELVEVMGGSNAPLADSTKKPAVILMAGLQGAGKTTATAKLGLHLK